MKAPITRCRCDATQCYRENCRMKWTIFKVKSDNLYDNHREKHKRTPAATLPTIALQTIMLPI